jgi:hypothetical protein
MGQIQAASSERNPQTASVSIVSEFPEDLYDAMRDLEMAADCAGDHQKTIGADKN